ncbi:protein of unknown function [Methylocella tundrae]|uniref:Uncharacterized protein n=1 Tax=Methylocella tundrae TaxID=227605 RepID=A0A4U8Z5E6_METTU|nr:protein of unknown function [Methylocella tundrae]
MMLKPKFAAVSLTEAAAARARELIEAAGKPVAGIKVGIKKWRLRRHELCFGPRRRGSAGRRSDRGSGRQYFDRAEGSDVSPWHETRFRDQ